MHGSDFLGQMLDRLRRETDRLFVGVLLAQWVFSAVIAIASGLHVTAAIGLGALINTVPVALALRAPGQAVTRHMIAASQMFWSALLVMLTGGRIETHFHVFVSLAFLAFYRDWRVLLTAATCFAGDHLLRGLLWPESIYGVDTPDLLRTLEHISWVGFEVLVLAVATRRTLAEMAWVANRDAELQTKSSRVEAEVSARTQEIKVIAQRYHSLVDSTHAIPFECDTETFRFTYVSPQAVRLLDGDGPLADVVHGDDRIELRSMLRSFARTGLHATPLDVRLIAHSGRTVFMRCFASDRDSGKRIVRGIFVDITNQRVMESELREAQKLESVGRLAAGIAHEINTPVQYISDSIEFARQAVGDLCASTVALLANKAPPAEADLAYVLDELPKALDRAHEGSQRVAEIVRSMKTFAHPNREAIGWCNVNDALSSTLTIARNEYKYVADVELDLGEVPKIRAALGELNQVFLNIIVNAAHAIDDTGKRGSIRVTTRQDDCDVVVAITDTGGGIPDSVRPHVFEMFFTTKPVGKGTGQGLAIAHSVVAKHGGTLTFESEIGRGTTFNIRLPIEGVAELIQEAA